MLLPGGRIDVIGRAEVGLRKERVSVGSLPMQDRLRLSYRYLMIHELCICSHDTWHFKNHLKPGHHRLYIRMTSTCCKRCKKCELPIRMESHEVHEKTCTLQVDTSVLNEEHLKKKGG